MVRDKGMSGKGIENIVSEKYVSEKAQNWICFLKHMDNILSLFFFHLWNSKTGLSEVLGSLHQTAFWLTPCKNTLLNNFCFMTISFLNCFGDKLCCAKYQWSFISCKMCIIKGNIYLLIKLAKGNPMELYQLLRFNSIVKINFYHCQVFAVSHFFSTAFQISRNLNDLIVSQELTYRCDD